MQEEVQKQRNLPLEILGINVSVSRGNDPIYDNVEIYRLERNIYSITDAVNEGLHSREFRRNPDKKTTWLQ